MTPTQKPTIKFNKEALFEAIENGRVDLVGELARQHPGLTKKTEVDGPFGRGENAIEAAIRHRNEGCLAILAPLFDPLEKRATTGDTLLIFAATWSFAAGVKMLLPVSDPFAASDRGDTALIRAAKQKSLECIELLLPACDAMARDADGATALMWAANGRSDRQLGCVQALLPVSDPKAADREGRTALMRAVALDCVETAKALRPVSDAFARDKRGFTAFATAMKANGWNCARELAADVPKEEVEGHWLNAAAQGWAPAVTALREHCSPEATGELDGVKGRTALMMSAFAGRLECVRELLPGSDARKKDEEGNTAFILAARGWNECLEALLPFSDPGETNNKGQTAFDFAVEDYSWGSAAWLAPRTPSEVVLRAARRSERVARMPYCQALLEQEELAQAARDPAARAPAEEGLGSDGRESVAQPGEQAGGSDAQAQKKAPRGSRRI